MNKRKLLIMKSIYTITSTFLVLLLLIATAGCKPNQSQTLKDAESVERQQSQYSKSQPVPSFDWSLERDLLIQLYTARNMSAVTHSVWRSDYGLVEGDCTSIGFGIPFDTSLTNPLKGRYFRNGGAVTIEQAEPNGVFASKNTSATWVMCAGDGGTIDPIYVESKVTAYPYPVSVDYSTNRVTKSGKSSTSLKY